MKEKNYTWHKLVENIGELSFPEGGGLLETELGGKKICVSMYKGQLHACAARCPHAGGKLSEGFTDGLGNIVCPLHRYRFNLQNGYNSSGEGYFLKTYPVKQTENGIFIGFEAGGLMNWLK